MLNIGILGLQGAFVEHQAVFERLGCRSKVIRQKSDLQQFDALVFPGGESTVQGKLLRDLDLLDPLRAMIEDGIPVLATCAGMILLAKRIENDHRSHLATLPVTVRRNAYGRQLGSFVSRGSFGSLEEIERIFIRAPVVSALEQGVEVLAKEKDEIVAVRYGNQVAMAFHPEMSEDNSVHSWFLQLVRCRKENLPNCD